jgi:two-component SAPR family response regulator
LGECDALAAAQLYRGGFAPELYDDWAEDLRRETEARFLARISVECEALLESDPQAASAVATRLSEIAPLSEDAWILRVRAELACGDSHSARSTLGRARALLERELGSQSGSGLRTLERELEDA